MEKLLALDENTLHIIGEIIARLEKQEGMERAIHLPGWDHAGLRG